MIWIFLLAILVVGGTVFISSLYVVKQQSVAIIERFGRYQKISNSGIHVRAPFGIDKIAARVQLRLLQSEIVVETTLRASISKPESISSRRANFGSNINNCRISLRFFSPPEKPSFKQPRKDPCEHVHPLPIQGYSLHQIEFHPQSLHSLDSP